VRAGVVLLLAVPWTVTPARAEQQTIDAERSTVRIHAFKAGLFSAFAHDHVVAAPIAEGWIDTTGTLGVELRFSAADLRVLDPGLSPGKRAEVQKTMEGPEVLDVARHRDVLFRSASVDPAGENRWAVEGTLTLHGEARPVRAQVRLEDGRYRGTVTIRQREFKITPVSLLGGAVRVKDEVRVEFEIVPTGS